jgi:hypothetical protein
VSICGLQAQHLRRLEGLVSLTGIQSAQLADNELSNVDGLADLHLLSSLDISVRLTCAGCEPSLRACRYVPACTPRLACERCAPAATASLHECMPRIAGMRACERSCKL